MHRVVLIVPSGIETVLHRIVRVGVYVLIVPSGIETKAGASSFSFSSCINCT